MTDETKAKIWEVCYLPTIRSLVLDGMDELAATIEAGEHFEKTLERLNERSIVART